MLKAVFGALWDLICARLFGGKKNFETQEAEHAAAANREEAELFTKPHGDWDHTIDDL